MILSRLKDHPFAVQAFFESSIVLTFALPKAVLEPFLPECLSLDTHNDQWAFIAVAMVQTRGLRPKGFPEFMGNNFFLSGYRIFVRYTNNAGKKLRGLYILKSETDRKKMEFMGNIFTHYNYSTTDISTRTSENKINITSQKTKFSVSLEKDNAENISLPTGSIFKDWAEARRFAGPRPFTFTYNPEKKEVLIIEGLRENWKPMPIKVLDFNIPFLQELQLPQATLANAFMIENVPYEWKKGKVEKWTP